VAEKLVLKKLIGNRRTVHRQKHSIVEVTRCMDGERDHFFADAARP
jgi:hypothetical protein